MNFQLSTNRTYISPGSWFALTYPSGWCESEDAEDSFLFYNPDKWAGNFRISAYRGESRGYAKECMEDELAHTRGAKPVQVGNWKCVYWAESFQENANWYTTHFWITGQGAVSVECSFTVVKGENIKVAEEIIASLRVRRDDEKSWKAVIPVRILEINGINEAYDWAVLTIKKQLTKDFTGCEADIDRIQQVMDSGRFKSEQRQAWESFGIAFGTILVNEMDGMDWVTVIDGKQEYPALRFADTEVMVYPTKLVWDAVRNGKTCNLKDEYWRIRTEVEKALSK